MSKIRASYKRFQMFLYQRLILSGEYSVPEVARKMSVPVSTLYHYIEGESTFPVDLVAPLYNATKDVELLNFILRDTDMMLAERQQAGNIRTLLEEVLDVAAASGYVVSSVQQAMKDRQISRMERDAIIPAINKGLKELEDLRQCMERI